MTQLRQWKPISWLRIFGSVLVTDGQPEGSVRFQHARYGGDPLLGPVEVLLLFELVVVDVVLVTDVEWRVGKGQIDGAFRECVHGLNAVAQLDRVQVGIHPGELRFGTQGKSRAAW